MFDPVEVQQHNQCTTEEEKYFGQFARGKKKSQNKNQNQKEKQKQKQKKASENNKRQGDSKKLSQGGIFGKLNFFCIFFGF